jgi:hypothetical protein
MIKFTEFLTEVAETGSGQLKHIVHPEDLHFIEGSKGTKHALGALQQSHEHILKGKHDSSMSMKYDGSPALVFGHHPQTGKFFVATKSAFNKTPKINYSHDDVDANHGHAPGLAAKLHDALDHLHKVMPKKGVYQGDLMYGKGDVMHNKDGSASFTPNTITYTAHGREANHVKQSKVGIVVHQKYHGRDITDMHAKPDVDRQNFKRHADVWNKSPLHNTASTNYSTKSQLAFKKHMDAAKTLHDKNPDMYKHTEPHHGESGHLASYANHVVKAGEKPSVRGLQQHIIDKHEKELGKLKTDSARSKKKAEALEHVNHIKTHGQSYENFLKMHQHMQAAKNELVNTLNQNHGTLTHHIDGTPTTPEGHVVLHKGRHVKLVNRAEFSKKNLLKVRK